MSWNCYCGTLSFDVVTMYDSCKTAYQSIISTGTLSSKKFHWFCLSDKVPRQLSYRVVVPGLYQNFFIITQQGRLLQLIHWYMKTVFSFQCKILFRKKLSCTSNMNHLNKSSWQEILSDMDYMDPDVHCLWKQQQGSRSTLAQVMACCLTAPSHYLNQCWLMISEVFWHSPVSNLTKNT